MGSPTARAFTTSARTEKTLRNVGPFAFPLKTHVAGLFQCGASTLAAGINGVSKGGLHVAAAALGCRPDELLGARGQTLRILPADDPASWPDALRPKPAVSSPPIP
jgi:all-trans-retinol 13,14-reductase